MVTVTAGSEEGSTTSPHKSEKILQMPVGCGLWELALSGNLPLSKGTWRLGISVCVGSSSSTWKSGQCLMHTKAEGLGSIYLNFYRVGFSGGTTEFRSVVVRVRLDSRLDMGLWSSTQNPQELFLGL